MGNDENMAAYAQMDMRGVAAQALRDLDAAKARIAELEGAARAVVEALDGASIPTFAEDRLKTLGALLTTPSSTGERRE